MADKSLLSPASSILEKIILFYKIEIFKKKLNRVYLSFSGEITCNLLNSRIKIIALFIKDG